MEKISAVYKIVNELTGDSYVGSSKNVMSRWCEHKCLSTWKKCPNKQLYKDFQKYGLENFRFQILAPVMEEHLKEVEQEFIEILKPTYNNYNAKGFDTERNKEYHRTYNQSDKRKESEMKRSQTEKRKRWKKNYYNQFCLYNGKELTFGVLVGRFQRAGIKRPYLEAKKYLIGE